MSAFSDFVLAHENDDTSRLLLERDRHEGVDISLAVNTILARRKMARKAPSWYAVEELEYPGGVSAEQCSSEETALYKAALAERLSGDRRPRIADLTGGLGLDSWAFSKVSEEVLYNEMDTTLAEVAGRNFMRLGLANVSLKNARVAPASVGEIAGDFSPTIIYLDPARRSASGSKVFRLEDCSPDVVPLLPGLLDVCSLVMLKLSPMADISAVRKKLPGVAEVHVVGADGECKELLAVIRKGFAGEPSVTVADGDASFTFFPSEETAAAPRYSEGLGEKLLFEPGKALSKAAPYKLLCTRFGLKMAGRDTRLYLADDIPDELKALGKTFSVERVLPFGKSGVREAAAMAPEAEISARGVPLSSDDLRRRIGSRSGGEYHIFGAGITLASGESTRKLLVCRRILP